MKSIMLIIGITAVLVVLNANTAGAVLSLGSSTGQKSANAYPGGTVQFRILLFNIHEPSDIGVELSAEAPGKWNTEISPQSFDLEYFPAGACLNREGYECLSTGEGDVMARPFMISVEVPDSAKTGSYDVILISTVRGDGHFSMEQSRSFHFTVNVKEKAASRYSESSKSSKLSNAAAAGNESQVQHTAAYGNETNMQGPDYGNPVNTGGSANTFSPAEGLTGGLFASPVETAIISFVVLLILLVSWKIYRMD